MKYTCLKFIAAVTLCLALAVGCSAIRKLNDLTLGMTRSDVISLLGEPEIAREQITNKYDQNLELWHYELYDHRVDAYEPYFLYFYEDKLVRWGKAVDLPREKVYEMKFK